MLLKITALSLLMSVSYQAEAKRIGLAAQFALVPIEKAHQISGKAYDKAFDPYSIKVFVWNIKKTQEAGWKEEFASFSKGSDLILIQEAYKNKLFTSALEKKEGFRWDMGVAFLYKKDNNTETGTVIGSTVEPTNVIVKHSRDHELVIDTPKALTIATYPVKGIAQDLLAISIHAINITPTSFFRRNMEQVLNEIKKHDGPILVSGDFNTWSGERTDYMFSKLKELGLKSVEMKNDHQRMKFKMTGRYLDWAFVRNIKVRSAEVIGSAKGSDHKPMVLDLEVER